MKPAAALAACGLLAACASVGPSVAPPPVEGYLDSGSIQRLAVLAVPPLGGPNPDDISAAQTALPGSDRWWLATAHAELRPPEAAQHFDCVLGARLAERPRPALTRLMNRLLVDADSLARGSLATEPRNVVLRPIAVVADLEPCQRVTDEIRNAPAWPAGGAIVASAYGELFAELAPDRADQARQTGREIAYSRVVCRMNWAADVEAGIDEGQALFAHAARTPALQADLAAARAEVTAAREEGLTSPGCAAERRALRQWSAPEPPMAAPQA